MKNVENVAPGLALGVAEALNKIEQGVFDCVSFDVFDTLVWRPVGTPSDLFAVLGREMSAAGELPELYDPSLFPRARALAERAARLAAHDQHETPECTFEEIWEQLLEAVGLGISAADGVERELALEGRTLRLHTLGGALFDAAKTSGASVAIISDIYMSSEQLAALLARVGLDVNGVQVHTSADARLGKYAGLLDDVRANHPELKRWLHVGDNPVSDIECGQAAGMDVCHVDVAHEDNRVNSAMDAWKKFSRSQSTDGGCGAIVRECLADNEAHGSDPSYQFGVAVAGPVMAGFVLWVQQRAVSLRATRVYCMLREGAKIAELSRLMSPDGLKMEEIAVSRWAIMRAAVIEGTPKELERALGRRGRLTAAHIAEAFALEPAFVEHLIGGASVDVEQHRDVFDVLADDPVAKAAILAEATRLRSRVHTYLDTVLGDDAPIVLCDVGWGGTIQEGLEAILRERGDTRPVIGLYLMLSPAGEHRVAHGAVMCPYIPTFGHDAIDEGTANTLMRYPEFLERINTPRLGTVLGYDLAGVPVTQPVDHDPISPSLALAQEGVLDFCERACALLTDTDTELWSSGVFAPPAAQALASVIASPEYDLACALGAWQHDDVAGTDFEPLVNDRANRWISYMNAVDASMLTMRDLYWVAGAASVAKADFGSGLVALSNGTPPDVVAPRSVVGRVLVAVFPQGSGIASDQFHEAPRVNAAGWMLVELDAAVDELGAIRVEVAESDVVVEFGDVLVEVETSDGTQAVIDGLDDLSSGVWIGGRWMRCGWAVSYAGGHMMFDIDPVLAPAVRRVSISVAMRVSPVVPGEGRLRRRVVQQAGYAKRAKRKLDRVIAQRAGEASEQRG